MPKKTIIEEMYLRDWFAGMSAMRSLRVSVPEDAIEEARHAYLMADAMMKVRMERPGHSFSVPGSDVMKVTACDSNQKVVMSMESTDMQCIHVTGMTRNVLDELSEIEGLNEFFIAVRPMEQEK
jgi:hypothetical protein